MNMSTLIVSDFFAQRAKLSFSDFSVGDIAFVLMAVDDGQREEIELCETSKEMVGLAADFGISYDRKRVVDDKELAKDMGMMWDAVLSSNDDDDVRTLVGVKVLELSDLSKVFEEMVQSEATKAASHELDGDNLGDTSVTMGQLDADAAAAGVNY